jgi:ribosomal protein S18 acetylase RimI-like enzyme
VNPRVRVVDPSEAAELAPVLARLHLEAHDDGMALGLLAPQDADALADAYRTLVATLNQLPRVLLVAELEGEVVGMAQLAPSDAQNAAHRAEVQRVAVATDARGKGVGRELMLGVEREARVRGLTLLWLTTHDGTAAARFYEALGYSRLGVMPNYSRRPDGELAPGAFYYRTVDA